MELTLEVWVWTSLPKGMKAVELTLPPAYGSIEWPSWNSAGKFVLVVQRRKGKLSSSATTQAQIQGFELAHPTVRTHRSWMWLLIQWPGPM